jgi:hypothetical protein
LLALIFGIPARTHLAAKAGLFLAAAALILYLVYLRSGQIAITS